MNLKIFAIFLKKLKKCLFFPVQKREKREAQSRDYVALRETESSGSQGHPGKEYRCNKHYAQFRMSLS